MKGRFALRTVRHIEVYVTLTFDSNQVHIRDWTSLLLSLFTPIDNQCAKYEQLWPKKERVRVRAKLPD